MEQIFRNRSILTHLSITKYCRKYVRAFILSSKPLDQLCYYVDRLVFLINCSTLINMVHKLWALEFFTVERTWRFLSRLKPPNYLWQNTLVTGHIKMYFWFILYSLFQNWMKYSQDLWQWSFKVSLVFWAFWHKFASNTNTGVTGPWRIQSIVHFKETICFYSQRVYVSMLQKILFKRSFWYFMCHIT